MLHGTAHDVVMASPGLGDHFRAVGVIAANRQSVTAALAQGDDVVVWPGGEVDAMRSWRKCDVAALAGRTGFLRSVHDRVEASIQAGMDRLAEKRTLPVFG
jgi:hypothetical protein